MHLRVAFVLAAWSIASFGTAANAQVIRDIAYDSSIGRFGLGDLYLPEKVTTENIVSAGRGYLMVHAASDGEKTIRLPSRCDVCELYGARKPLKDAIEIREFLKKGETLVYRMDPDPCAFRHFR